MNQSQVSSQVRGTIHANDKHTHAASGSGQRTSGTSLRTGRVMSQHPAATPRTASNSDGPGQDYPSSCWISDGRFACIIFLSDGCFDVFDRFFRAFLVMCFDVLYF